MEEAIGLPDCINTMLFLRELPCNPCRPDWQGNCRIRPTGRDIFIMRTRYF